MMPNPKAPEQAVDLLHGLKGLVAGTRTIQGVMEMAGYSNGEIQLAEEELLQRQFGPVMVTMGNVGNEVTLDCIEDTT